MTLKTRLNILIAVTLAVAVAATITVLRMNQANMAGLASNDETVNQAVSNISGELYPSLQACNTAKLAVVQVQQWLQDISSTRGLDGLDDGFDEADKWAAIFHEQIAYLHEHQPEREAELDEMNRAFDEFYATGTLMAQAYVDRGPSGGNAMMDEFDLVAGNINDMAETMVAEIEGEFKDAKNDGYGVMTYGDGYKYAGDWNDGLRHGQGTATYADGTVYDGEFKLGERSGFGKIVMPDGFKYEGGWKDGEIDGEGVATYANGDVYTGVFVMGKRQGQGTMVYASGETREGTWKDGQLVEGQ